MDRQHLREGACVLVDKEDQKTFREVLDGTYVESAPSPQMAMSPPEGREYYTSTNKVSMKRYSTATCMCVVC